MHPQDRLLVVEALVQFAGNPNDLSPRERRAWQLAEEITTNQTLPLDELVRQIDTDWRGPE